MLLKLKVTLGGNEFSVDTDAPLSDVVPSLLKWFAMQPTSVQQAAIDRLTERLMFARQKLVEGITRND